MNRSQGKYMLKKNKYAQQDFHHNHYVQNVYGTHKSNNSEPRPCLVCGCVKYCNNSFCSKECAKAHATGQSKRAKVIKETLKKLEPYLSNQES